MDRRKDSERKRRSGSHEREEPKNQREDRSGRKRDRSRSHERDEPRSQERVRVKIERSGSGEREDLRSQREERLRHDRERIERRRRERSSSPAWGRSGAGFGGRKSDVKSEQKPDVKAENIKKEKPNFETSGKLAEDTNTFRGVVIKYNEPSESRKPKRRWRLYIFKGETSLPFLPLHRQSAYLIGRDRLVADIPVDHPSCSKQHAALQYRLVDYKRPDGTNGRRVRPYIIDLNSANGTFVNGKKIEPQRYVELFEKDVIKFGFSSRDYVLLHDNSDANAIQEDDNA